jgi:signal transduction histidine kinase
LQAIAGDLFLIEDDVASLDDGETKKSLQESITSIQANVMYIAKIVEDLQDYARPLKPNFEQVRIDKVIEEVMLIVPVSSGHEVVLNLEADLPSFASDFSMLKRIMTNLVQNALQAMPNSGRLTINACQKDDRILISIEDTGVGIPEEVKPKIFMPMMTTKSKGQGLGLAVVKRLVEALNGAITFESQEGKGTIFTVELPLLVD